MKEALGSILSTEEIPVLVLGKLVECLPGVHTALTPSYHINSMWGAHLQSQHYEVEAGRSEAQGYSMLL